MKAALYYGPGDIRIEEIRTPKASTIGAVVKIKACGVCPILDLNDWVRYPAGGHTIGLARGHEWSGEIVEVGSAVENFKVGDRVGGMEPLFRPCFRCDFCQQGDYWRCSNVNQGMGIHGAFAEYMALSFVSSDALMAFPDTIGFRDLAMLEPLGVGAGLVKRAKIKDVVAVLGQEPGGIKHSSLP